MGSNELGLDRGEIGSEFIARFERTGDKLFLVLRNPSFRVETAAEPESRTGALRRSVEESFPTSTLGGFEIVAEDEASVLVDMTDFFLSDALDVAGDLRDDDQGDFRVDAERSRIHRPRLEKASPDAERSRPVEPIVYYLDPAVPEPYRSAFAEGGMWWNDVLEAAGWIDAFRIEEMPADMDPLDARYTVIQWVHRTEAGSSIGPSFIDPRTGEIIKAAVRMDSHRSLVDHNLWAGVVPATGGGSGVPGGDGRLPGELHDDTGLTAGADGSLDWLADLDPNVGSTDFAMARRKQHSADEIGHTLGLAHNFIAVSYGRASVMDYPAPLIKFADEAAEDSGLDAIVREAMDRGAKFITNPNAGASDSYPDASWWINGADVLDELERVTEVRRVLLDRFDETAIEPGELMWKLNERDPELPSLEEIVGRMVGETWSRPARGEHAGLVRVVQRVVVDELVELAGSERATVEARAAAEWGLRRIQEQISRTDAASETDRDHRSLASADVRRFLERTHRSLERTEPLAPPPGTPIGERPPGR